MRSALLLKQLSRCFAPVQDTHGGKATTQYNSAAPNLALSKHAVRFIAQLSAHTGPSGRSALNLDDQLNSKRARRRRARWVLTKKQPNLSAEPNTRCRAVSGFNSTTDSVIPYVACFWLCPCVWYSVFRNRRFLGLAAVFPGV